MTKKTLLYIDPGFQVDLGHYTRMGAIIKEEAKASNIELLHFVNLDVPSENADELGLIRSFKYLAGLQWLEEPGNALRDFHMKLDKILQGLIKKEDDNTYELFMYTAHPLHLPIIVFLLNKYFGKLNGLSAHICLFYINLEFCQGDSGTDEYKTMLKEISRLIGLFDPYNLMTLCADSERTARLYGPYFERELKVLPMPVERACRIAEEIAEAKDEIAIGYIGQATKRAGYHFVYNAYKQISEMEIFSGIKFKIKHTRREQLSDVHSKFLSESKNITHVNDFLSNKAYEEFFSDCDVILLPYSRKFYPCNTSGVVAEALFRSKIIIVPEKTWMSDQIIDYGSGETFISDNLESFVQAVVKVVKNFEYYKKRTGRNLEKYRNLYSCSNLFTEIGLNKTELKVKSKTDSIKMSSYTGPVEELMIENVVLMQEKDRLIRPLIQKNIQIKNRDAQIKKREIQIKNRDAQIKKREIQITNRDAQIKKREIQITNRDAQIKKREIQIKNRDAQIKKREIQIKNRDAQIKKREIQITNRDAQIKKRDVQIQMIRSSLSWKITAPLRLVANRLKLSNEDG